MARSKETKLPATAMVLAGGYGTRLNELTRDRYPKHLHQIAGVPLIDRTIEPFTRAEVSSVVLMLSHMAHMIISHYAGTEGVEFYVAEKPKGVLVETRDAVKTKGIRHDVFLAEGDSLREGLEVRGIFSQHQDTEAIATVVATSKPGKDALGLHGVIFDNKDRVRIREPHDPDPNNHPLVGMMVLSPTALTELNNAGDDANSWSGILEVLSDTGRLRASVQEIDYFNINSPEAVIEAEEYLAGCTSI